MNQYSYALLGLSFHLPQPAISLSKRHKINDRCGNRYVSIFQIHSIQKRSSKLINMDPMTFTNFTYASYGALRTLNAPVNRPVRIPEPEFAPLDLSHID
jgi:hypothetical protein